MKYINLNNTSHKFDKKNLVTIRDGRGPYDQLECEYCGLKAKRRSLTPNVEVSKRTNDDRLILCPKAPEVVIPDEVIVLQCDAQGAPFANCQYGEVLPVVEPPEGHQHDYKGVWVQGAGEPVKLLNREFLAL